MMVVIAEVSVHPSRLLHRLHRTIQAGDGMVRFRFRLFEASPYHGDIRLIDSRILTSHRVVDVRYVTVAGTTPWTTDEHAVC